MASMRVQEIQRKIKNTGFSGSQKTQSKMGSQHMQKKPPMNHSSKIVENALGVPKYPPKSAVKKQNGE